MATIAMQTNDAENAPIEVKAASATGKGTHTRFCDDNDAAEKVLADISNKEQEVAKEAAKEQPPAEPKEAEAEAEEAEEAEEAAEEQGGEEEGEGEGGEDDKMAYRKVPSHFYPESKTRDTKFCGTHKRFEDEDEAEAKPLSDAEKATMDALASDVSGAMVLDPKEPAK